MELAVENLIFLLRKMGKNKTAAEYVVELTNLFGTLPFIILDIIGGMGWGENNLGEQEDADISYFCELVSDLVDCKYKKIVIQCGDTHRLFRKIEKIRRYSGDHDLNLLYIGDSAGNDHRGIGELGCKEVCARGEKCRGNLVYAVTEKDPFARAVDILAVLRYLMEFAHRDPFDFSSITETFFTKGDFIITW